MQIKLNHVSLWGAGPPSLCFAIENLSSSFSHWKSFTTFIFIWKWKWEKDKSERESECKKKGKVKVREMPRTRALGRECWPLAGIYHWWSQFHHFLAAKRTLCHRGSQWWGPRWCWEGIWAVLAFGKTTIRRKTVPPIDPNFYDTRVPCACWAQIRWGVFGQNKAESGNNLLQYIKIYHFRYKHTGWFFNRPPLKSYVDRPRYT